MTVQKTSSHHNIAERIYALRKQFAKNGTQHFGQLQTFRAAVGVQAQNTFNRLNQDEFLKERYVNSPDVPSPIVGWTINGNWSADKH